MRPAPRAAARFGFWAWVAALLLPLLAGVTVLRFTRGLGATTNLSDRFPWGLWIGFDVLCGVGAGGGRLHADERRPPLQPAPLRADRAADGADGVPRLRLRDRGADVRPRPALAHLARARVLEPALGDVRGGVVRDALHDRAGARAVARRLRALPARGPAAGDPHRLHAARDRRGDPLDAAPVVARLALPDRALEAAPALVLAAAAAPLLHLRDRGGPRHGDHRVLPERALDRAAPGASPARAARPRDGGGARRVRCAALPGAAAQRRARRAADAELRVADVPAGDLAGRAAAGRPAVRAARARERARPRGRGLPGDPGLRDEPPERRGDRHGARGGRPLPALLDGAHRLGRASSPWASRSSPWRPACCRSSPRPAARSRPSRTTARRTRSRNRSRPEPCARGSARS